MQKIDNTFKGLNDSFNEKSLVITYEKTDDLFFELGRENKIVKKILSQIELYQKFSISVNVKDKKIKVKRINSLKDNSKFICVIKNKKDAVMSKLEDIDLIDENNENIEVEVELLENEIITIPFNNCKNKRIVIDFVN